jgi:hypothetical protein
MEPSEPRSPVLPRDVDPVTPGRHRPSRAWYALTAIPLLIAGALSVRALIGLVDRVDAMQRFVVPGSTELELPRGEQVVYGETRSVVDGVGYASSSYEVRCSLENVASAEPLRLDAPSGTTTYSFGRYKGESLWEVDHGDDNVVSAAGPRRGRTRQQQRRPLASGGA